jgi:thioredoxin 1
MIYDSSVDSKVNKNRALKQCPCRRKIFLLLQCNERFNRKLNVLLWSIVMSEIIKHLDDKNFSEEISSGVVLVDFYAQWCSPCRMFEPILETVADKMKETASFAKVDTDQAPSTAQEYSISSVPTLILFKDGKEVDRSVGLKDEDSLEKFVAAALL